MNNSPSTPSSGDPSQAASPDAEVPEGSLEEASDVGDSSDLRASSPTLSEAVGKAAFHLQPDIPTLPTGVKASLRRMDPSEPVCPALFRVLVMIGQDEAPDWISQRRWERRWGAVLQAAALCPTLHDYDRPLGTALARAEYSEGRFTSLMEATSEALFTRSYQAARYLSGKNEPFNLDDLRRLLFYQSGETGRNIRMGISRAFYRVFSADE